MRTYSLSPQRGLLAGLLALVLFAASAVAMTARRSVTTSAGAQAQPAQIQNADATARRGDGGFHGDGGRGGDDDGGGRFGAGGG